MWTWMTLDVSLLVGFFAEERILVPTSVNEQNVAVLHIGALLDIFGCEKSYIVQHIAHINDHTRTVTPFNRDLINRLAFGHKMPRRIEMCSHMVRCLDILRIDSMLRFPLDVFHLNRRVKRPERTILVEVLGKIVDFGHGELLCIKTEIREL